MPMNDSLVEPKSVQIEVPEIFEPVKEHTKSDVVYTLHIKREHLIIGFLSFIIVLLGLRLSFVSGRLNLLESSYTTRMK